MKKFAKVISIINNTNFFEICPLPEKEDEFLKKVSEGAEYEIHLLNEGEMINARISKWRANHNGHYIVPIIIKNVDDLLIIEEDRSSKIAFAKKAKAEIRKKFPDIDPGKIFRKSGPGAALKAVEFGNSLYGKFPEDFLITVLNQKGPAETQLGQTGVKNVFRDLGIEPPESRNSAEFFKILQGAREFVLIKRRKSLNQ